MMESYEVSITPRPTSRRHARRTPRPSIPQSAHRAQNRDPERRGAREGSTGKEAAEQEAPLNSLGVLLMVCLEKVRLLNEYAMAISALHVSTTKLLQAEGGDEFQDALVATKAEQTKCKKAWLDFLTHRKVHRC
jgi:hypothetical protein